MAKELSGPDSARQGQPAEVRAADPDELPHSALSIKNAIAKGLVSDGAPSAMEHTLKQWSANPRKLWDWRSGSFRRSLLVLEKLALNPQERTADQLKALELLNKMSERIDDVKEDLETSCPKCRHRFVPGT